MNSETPAKSPDYFRSLELSRLQALVQRNLQLADTFHASDLQLVTPSGRVYSKAEYLNEIETRQLNYWKWEPKAIDVRLFEGVALLRYQADLVMGDDPDNPTPFTCWHTDSYELRGGLWQVVWSHATIVR